MGGQHRDILLAYTPTDTLLQELEATLHCTMSIQEAVPLESNQHLSRLFSPEVLGQLPVSGGHRIRRTVLSLIGTSRYLPHRLRSHPR